MACVSKGSRSDRHALMQEGLSGSGWVASPTTTVSCMCRAGKAVPLTRWPAAAFSDSASAAAAAAARRGALSWCCSDGGCSSARGVRGAREAAPRVVVGAGLRREIPFPLLRSLSAGYQSKKDRSRRAVHTSVLKTRALRHRPVASPSPLCCTTGARLKNPRIVTTQGHRIRCNSAC